MGERLREARKAKDVALHEAAAAAGVTRQTLALSEQGRRKPSIEELEKLSVYYGQSIMWLSGGGEATPIRPREIPAEVPR